MTPVRSVSTSARIDLREIKFGGITGGKVRERLTVGITPGSTYLDLATPKGEA